MVVRESEFSDPEVPVEEYGEATSAMGWVGFTDTVQTEGVKLD